MDAGLHHNGLTIVQLDGKTCNHWAWDDNWGRRLSRNPSMEAEVTRQRFHTESRMRENRTLRLRYATASQAGSMRVSRRETAKSVLRVAEDRADLPDEYTTPHGRPKGK